MPLNEYIIGNLYTHKEGNMNEYYSTIFTHNSNKIIFDIQSKVVNYYINVGDNRKPTITDYDYKIENTGEDTLFEIARTDFLNKCKEKGVDIPHENSLLGLSLTVGLWTNKTDELNIDFSLKKTFDTIEKIIFLKKLEYFFNNNRSGIVICSNCSKSKGHFIS